MRRRGRPRRGAGPRRCGTAPAAPGPRRRARACVARLHRLNGAAPAPSQQRRAPAMFVFKAAVVGAGTMGGQIAQTIAAAGIPVVLKDIDDALVQAGIEEAAQRHGRARRRNWSSAASSPPSRPTRCSRRSSGRIEGTHHLRRLRRRRLRGRGGARAHGDQAGRVRRARRRHARATRSSPRTRPRCRSPRSATRRCAPTRSSAFTTSTRPRSCR